jgi:hypothetical protein
MFVWLLEYPELPLLLLIPCMCLFVLCILVGSPYISFGTCHFSFISAFFCGWGFAMFCIVSCWNTIFICVPLKMFVIFFFFVCFPLYVKMAPLVFWCCRSVFLLCVRWFGCLMLRFYYIHCYLMINFCTL